MDFQSTVDEAPRTSSSNSSADKDCPLLVFLNCGLCLPEQSWFVLFRSALPHACYTHIHARTHARTRYPSALTHSIKNKFPARTQRSTLLPGSNLIQCVDFFPFFPLLKCVTGLYSITTYFSCMLQLYTFHSKQERIKRKLFTLTLHWWQEAIFKRQGGEPVSQ